MKKNFKFLFPALLALTLGLVGCRDRSIPQPSGGSKTEVASVAFEGLEPNAKLQLELGAYYTLTPVITYKDENSKPVTPRWINSNPRVTSLDDGIVTAIGYGKSTISIVAGNVPPATVTFTVPQQETTEDTFVLNKESLNLKVGASFTLTASFNGQQVAATWSTNNDHVTVADGVVTANSIGNSVVTASYNNKNATCNVIVSEEGEFEISVSPRSATLSVNETLQLEVTTSEAATVTYSSDSDSIASVSATGLVTAHAVGNATITASANGKNATCEITVKEAQDPLKNATVYFFIDYNNADPEDETGTKRLAKFDWYQNVPFKTAPVPNNPADSLAPDPAFPYFIGWSAHSIIDSKDDLWDMDKDVIGTAYSIYIFGIWSDVPKGEFTK